VKVSRFLVNFVLIAVLGAVALATSVALLVPAARTLAAAVTPLPALDVSLKAQPQRSYVFDRNGNLMTTLYHQDRSPVKLANVPQQLIDAVLSIEDRKFYEHNGVDLPGTIRALTRNVDSGTIQQGASTITEQLIKNTLDKGKKRTAKLKINEAVLAVRLENELTKTQILEDYLNLVPFGNNAYGIEAASERYFNQTMFQLTLPESALLAGLVQAPSALDPILHPTAAARRRTQVLEAMVANHKITTAQEAAADSAPLPTKLFYPEPSQRSYYIDALLEQLTNPNPKLPSDPANVLGLTRAQATQLLYEGGLRIYTNYDPAMQFEAQLSIAKNVPSNQSQFTAALVSIDNSNGAIRAVAFGKGYDASQFDPAVDGPGRQAGSSFKSITLAAALSDGYSPDDRVSGSSLYWRIGPGTGSDAFYNLSGDCHGNTTTLETAIAISDNCAFVRTELSLGPGNYGHDGAQKVIDMAAKMGIDTSHFSPVVSTTLGTNGVHPLEMAQAYSVIAADGVLHPAQFVSKIVSATGKVLFQNGTTGTRVLSPQVARTETQMLTKVLAYGTASGLTIDRPAAGKTGTTDQNQDAWFIGYTPQMTTAVWMGDPNAETPMTSVGGISVFGATYPADVWRDYMKAALASQPKLDFKLPVPTLWPRPQSISEEGRGTSSYYSNNYYNNNYSTTTLAPLIVPPVSATTVPRIVAPTTAPPVTVPHKPPPTTPPTAPPPATTPQTGP
jgi:membrane peptidoglycan carboxypeptidase